MTNPFGPYGNIVATIAALGVIAVALLVRVVGAPDAWLDNAALLCLGVIMGTQVVQNGIQSKANSALQIAQKAMEQAAEAHNIATKIIEPPKDL